MSTLKVPQGRKADSATLAGVLSAQPAGRRSELAALLVVGISALLFLAIAPFAKQPLGVHPIVVPVNQTILIVNDLITALLLLLQLRVTRSPALLVLACGYFYCALMASVHLLTFPGVFSTAGLLGAGTQTTGYLFVFWHLGLPMAAIGYTLLKRKAIAQESSRMPPIVAGLGLTVALVLGFAVLTTRGNDWFAPMLVGHVYSSGFNVGRFGQWALTALAIVIVWRSKPRSVLDLWLLVALCSWFIEIGLVGIFNAGRYDVGFYAGRIYGLLSSLFVLGVLLFEQARMYSGVVASRALKEAEAALRENDRRKDEFLATLAHELRNPLAPIRNSVDVLARLGPLPPAVERVRGVIDRQSQQLSRLVDDLLEVSRITQGKVNLRKSRVSIMDALRDALEATRPAADSARHELFVSLDDDKLYTEADASRLTQVFVNLLNNAIKFTPDGGQIFVSAHRAEGFACVKVRDTGIGVDAAHFESIFGIFSQVHSPAQRAQGGLGIGLALVRGFVQLHGGTVQVKSAGPGLGTEFTVQLPLQPGTPTEAPESPGMKPRHILVTDPQSL